MIAEWKIKSQSLVRSERFYLAVSFVVCFALYWPALGGGPIWDDLASWFYAPEMSLPIWLYWLKFSWPLSVTVQKLMLRSFGHDYSLYHLVNLTLHMVNSLLVFRMAKTLNWPGPRWIFILFLLHPASVISVGWMIQLKTLLCFLFAILSFWFFEKGMHRRGWLSLAFACFALSMLAKSASITLPILFFLYAYKRLPVKRSVLFVPFFLFSLWGSLILLKSPAVREVQGRYMGVSPVARLALPVQTAGYYLAQSVLPIETAPVRGRAPAFPQARDWLMAGFVCIVLILFWRARLARWLGGGFILLLPFLGLVRAPYMEITWVSDQHLYLALPLLLAFWMALFMKLPKPIANGLCFVLLAFFGVQTALTARDFSSEENFYKASLSANPRNVTLAFNFANTLAFQDKTSEALSVADGIHQMAKEDANLKAEPHYAELEALRQKLIEFQIYKKGIR